MRRSFKLIPVLAVLLVSPMGAQAATVTADDYVVCDAAPEGTTAVGPNASLTPEVASPAYDLVDYTWTDFQYQLDLYPAKATNKSTVTATLNWTLDLNDYDLFLLDADGGQLAASEGAQGGPIGDPPTESLSFNVNHCGSFTVRVYNFSAPISGEFADMLDPLQLSVTTGGVK